MSDKREEILRSIERAFGGVQLGDGVSLHETVVIDRYGSREERVAARIPDEKHDWRKLIADPDLARIGGGSGGLIFYDSRGLRFHLPAYLSLAVIDFERADAELVFDLLMFCLSNPTHERFAILDGTQRGCVRDVLVFLREEYELVSPDLDVAIQGWSTETT